MLDVRCSMFDVGCSMFSSSLRIAGRFCEMLAS
jgi:hypothetical protein